MEYTKAGAKNGKNIISMMSVMSSFPAIPPISGSLMRKAHLGTNVMDFPVIKAV
jgi:hypothetical protein